MAWWDENPCRFLDEVERMDKFTNAQLRVVDGDKLPGAFDSGMYLAWIETITSSSDCKYMVIVICGKDHPNSAPAVWILDPDVGRQRHVNADGSLNLREYDIPPDKAYVLNIRNLALEWIEYYETKNCHEFA